MSKHSATKKLQRCLRLSRPHLIIPKRHKDKQQPPAAASPRANEAAAFFRSQTAGLQKSEAYKRRIMQVHQEELLLRVPFRGGLR